MIDLNVFYNTHVSLLHGTALVRNWILIFLSFPFITWLTHKDIEWQSRTKNGVNYLDIITEINAIRS